MEKSTTDLIQELAHNYGPRPWWKNPKRVFVIWFSFHIIYFLVLGVLKSDSIYLRSSMVYVLFEISGAILSGGFFIYLYRYYELKDIWSKAILIMIMFWMGASFLIEDLFMGTVLHGRALSVSIGDFDCFWHATISAVGPLLIFPVLFRHFFFARPVLAMAIMSCHLGFLGSALNELNCPDREMWHLILGHQTSFIGVGLLMMMIIFVLQRRAFLRLSRHEKQQS